VEPLRSNSAALEKAVFFFPKVGGASRLAWSLGRAPVRESCGDLVWGRKIQAWRVAPGRSGLINGEHRATCIRCDQQAGWLCANGGGVGLGRGRTAVFNVAGQVVLGCTARSINDDRNIYCWKQCCLRIHRCIGRRVGVPEILNIISSYRY